MGEINFRLPKDDRLGINPPYTREHVERYLRICLKKVLEGKTLSEETVELASETITKATERMILKGWVAPPELEIL